MLALLAVLLIGIVLISGCIGEEKVKSGENQSAVESGEIHPTEESGKGTAVFAVKDAAANMGTISSVNVTIDKVEVHSETKGWINVSDTKRTYDLLELKAKGTTELISSANLDAGTYDQMRLYISKVVVVEDNIEKEVILPSNKLKIIADLEVKENETSVATFDFIADESLHITGEGKIIMAPVIKVETRTNTTVETKAENKVEIKGGKIKSNITVGMNEDGDIGEGVKIKQGAQLIIEDGKVKILNVSSEQALDIISDLNIVAGGEAEMKGNTWIVRGIDAETNETVEIKINAITGAVIGGKSRVNVTACEAECKTNCETKDLADCKAECKANGTIGCSAKADANCNTQCNTSLTASCEARCKNEAKVGCATKCATELLNKADCKANCEAEAMILCKTDCIVSGKASCKAECKSKADADCTTNLDVACNRQCQMSGGFRNCYSNCTYKC